MRQERISKTTARRRLRTVESQPLALAPTGAPDLTDADALLELIEQVLATD